MSGERAAPNDERVSVAGRRIVVTGAARGIGAAAVWSFVEGGADVIAMDVRTEQGRVATAAADLAGRGSASFRRVDVTDRDEVMQAFGDAVDRLSGLDGVVHVAAIERSTPLERINERELDAVLDVNVKGTVFVSQAAFPHLRASGGGVILNFGSDAAMAPYPGGAHYSASKGAVHSLTRTAAAEWGRYGIRVNTVVPAMWTDMYDEHRARLSPERLAAHDRKMARLIPLGGRFGDPSRDLAPVLEFLVSDASRFMTGQIIAVNGGVGMVR